MPTDAITEAVSSYARGRKRRLLAEADHLLLVVREGKLVAGVNAGDLNLLLGAAGKAAALYGAEALAVVVEGVFPIVETNPVTGNSWERGEAERLWLEHDGVEKGWVSEAQIVAVTFRTGETAEAVWPFRVADGVVAWGEQPLPLSGTGLAGALAGRLEGPVMDPARVPDPGDGFAGDPENGPFYAPEYGRVALDIGCTRILGNQLLGRGEACLIVESDDQAGRLPDQRGPPQLAGRSEPLTLWLRRRPRS